MSRCLLVLLVAGLLLAPAAAAQTPNGGGPFSPLAPPVPAPPPEPAPLEQPADGGGEGLSSTVLWGTLGVGLLVLIGIVLFIRRDSRHAVRGGRRGRPGAPRSGAPTGRASGSDRVPEPAKASGRSTAARPRPKDAHRAKVRAARKQHRRTRSR